MYGRVSSSLILSSSLSKSLLTKIKLKWWDILKRWLVYEASRPRRREINFGFMSMIAYDGGLRPKVIFIDKMRNWYWYWYFFEIKIHLLSHIISYCFPLFSHLYGTKKNSMKTFFLGLLRKINFSLRLLS